MTTTSTTSTTTVGCACSGGTPHTLKFATGLAAGTCGDLKNDGGQSFLDLVCGGLYFGGGDVGVPLPSNLPDQAVSILNASCNAPANPGPVTLTLTGAPSTQTFSNRNCTNVGCLFGPPLPIPNRSHDGAATSTCVINTISGNAAGVADCSTGTTNLSIPLSSALFLTGDSLPNRCVGGPTPGVPCGAGCSNAGGLCTGGGTCVNDTGRCASDGSWCCSDGDCPGSTCMTGACAGGSNSGKGCIVDTDCPGSSCSTFIQPCPICNPATLKCNGGPNNGLRCTPADSVVDGDYPTSHDCPPPAGSNTGPSSITFALTTGTTTRTATDQSTQAAVFCGFCKDTMTSTFKNPAVPCTSDADCSAVSGFTHCGQRTAGAFTANDVARTITLSGSPAAGATVGGPGVPATLVTLFCMPPTFNSLVDGALGNSGYDLPGPGAASLVGSVQLLP